MKRVVAIIQARSGSNRFPNKVLQKINGKSLLQIQFERLKSCTSISQFVIATTGKSQDDLIAAEAQRLQISCFRGSENDVLSRYYGAAQEHHADIVVRMTSDCPLVDPLIVDHVVKTYLEQQNAYDFVANTVPPPGTYPDGMDVEVFSFDLLKKAHETALKFSEREHVTFYMWKNPDLFKILKVDAPADHHHIRLTVDYPDDLPRIKKIVDYLEENSLFGHLEEIVDFIQKNPIHFESNHEIGEGWKPSLAKDSAPTQEVKKAPPLTLEKTEKAWKKAVRVIPGGAQTFSKGPNQFVSGVAPKMLVRGKGSHVWDLDGNEYIDYTLGLGPAILGHQRTEVNYAADLCARDYFISPPLPHPLETQLAEKLTSLIPCAEMVKYGKNGSDATAGAVRLARGITQRDMVAACGYHGWQDWYIGSTSRRKGVPRAVQELTASFEYNRIESLEAIFRAHAGNVACAHYGRPTFNMPSNNFLGKVRDLCTQHGALLIFDEIITGFRLNMGGAQTQFNVTPDLATFGKAIANGFPLSVISGKEEFMRHYDDIFVSFTFGGELPSIAAAIKTIEILEKENGIDKIAKRGKQFRDGINKMAETKGYRWIEAVGLDFWPEYIIKDEGGFRSMQILSLLQQEIVRRGILTRSAPFLSTSHSKFDIDSTLKIFEAASAVVNKAIQDKKVMEWLDGKLIQPVIRSEAPVILEKATS